MPSKLKFSTIYHPTRIDLASPATFGGETIASSLIGKTIKKSFASDAFAAGCHQEF
ncbi:hypothetical protein [Caballeronia sp.]|uniref:hypothetical protein n=1 Tax=Caballeronia sp. TaxID=1931223 RepID=UPI003C654400